MPHIREKSIVSEALRRFSPRLWVTKTALATVGIPFLVLIAMNGVFVASAVSLRNTEARLERTHRAKAELQALVGDLSQAEGGMGAYVVTHDISFLEPLDRARKLLSPRLERLKDLLSDPSQIDDLRSELVTAANVRLTALDRIRDHVQADEALPAALATSRHEMQRLQTIVSRMILRQDELLTDGRASARTLQMLAIGAAVASALSGFVGGLILLRITAAGTSGATHSSSNSPGTPTEPAAPPAITMTGSVLIVDDDARIRQLLHRWLAPHGLELRDASDANGALSAIAERAPAVMICDVHMPGADGLWLAERVRGLAPTTAIVLATGDSTVPPFESLRKGVVSYVLKPFRRDQLLAAVQDGLRWSATASGTDEKELSGRHRRLRDSVA
jgi:CheY-like chemotaxis protein/CHASE3 domain sensor protein